MPKLLEKPVSNSIIREQYYKIFPGDLNASNTMFGGQMIAMIDRLALVVAQRHSGQTCVTAAVDRVNFLGPAKLGDILIFQSALNRSWHTSMEVGIKVFAENYKHNARRHIVSAYLIFVALDEDKRPMSVPRVIPETMDEKRRYEEAGLRRAYREGKFRKLMQNSTQREKTV